MDGPLDARRGDPNVQPHHPPPLVEHCPQCGGDGVDNQSHLPCRRCSGGGDEPACHRRAGRHV